MKKILFITDHNPFTNSYGAEQRANVFMNAAIANDCMVDVAYISPTNSQIPTIDNNKIKVVLWGHKTTVSKSIFTKFLRYYGLTSLMPDKCLKAKIETIISSNNYDYIMCRYLHCAQKAGLWKYRNILILDIDDLPLQSTLSQLENDNKHKLLNKLFKAPISFILRHSIKRWIKHTYATFLPNREMANSWHTGFLPNIPIINTDNPNYKQSNNVLFVGLLNYRPNYRAIDRFVDNVMPLVIAKNPNAQLLVAGKGLPKAISDKWKDNPNVTELGFVNDLYDFYNSGNIVICPIEEGAGTNIKVIEAMAMGKACVMTKFCVKGFENIIENGVNAFVAKDDNDYAEKLTTLLDNKKLCKEILVNAHEKANKYYSQSTINEILSPLLKN